MSDSISLLLADVDGTLVTKEKILTDRAKAAIAALKEKKILFAITSGRPPRGMDVINDALHLETPIAGFNGGVFTRPEDGRVLQSKILAHDAAQTALDIIKKNGLVAWLYTPDDWYIPDPKGPHVARETWTVKFDPKIAGDFTPYLDQAVKIVGVSDDLAAVQACEAEAQKRWPAAPRPRARSPIISTSRTPTRTRPGSLRTSRSSTSSTRTRSPPSATCRTTCSCSRKAA